MRRDARRRGDVQVLVWHEHGQLAHAALALPGGWVLQKPSQAWDLPVCR